MRGFADEYFGTLVNAYLGAGGHAIGIKGGHAYVDVGTLNGYRTAMTLLMEKSASRAEAVLPSKMCWPSGRAQPASHHRSEATP
jgi:hypothetical protein